ncbi:MAG: 50S ribosomal protein L9 [Candidatus Paceibacterota bacterium]
MKIILLKDVAKLGRRFDTKEVSSGHALNLLIPQGLAIVATPEAVKKNDVERAKAEGERKVHADLLVKNIKDLDGVTLTIVGKANEKGHLFAGIHKEAIVAELQKQTELQIDPSFIELDQPLKTVGEHMIKVNGGGKSVTFKVVIA